MAQAKEARGVTVVKIEKTQQVKTQILPPGTAMEAQEYFHWVERAQEENLVRRRRPPTKQKLVLVQKGHS